MENIECEKTHFRKFERQLFPLKKRLLFYVRTQFQLNYILPLLSNLNRSIVLICHFTLEKNSFADNIIGITSVPLKLGCY